MFPKNIIMVMWLQFVLLQTTAASGQETVDVSGSDVSDVTYYNVPDRISLTLLTKSKTIRIPLKLNRRLQKQITWCLKTNGIPQRQQNDLHGQVGHYHGTRTVFQLRFRGGNVTKAIGHFDVNKTSYLVESINGVHVLKALNKTTRMPSLPNTGIEYLLKHTVSRHKRQTLLYEIELFLAVDFSFYDEWVQQQGDGASDVTSTLGDIIHHFALFLNGISVRYKSLRGSGYVVDVLLAGIYIAQNASMSPWSETLKQTTSSRPVISEESLTLFNDWLKSNAHIVPRYDHAMAVTAFDLVNKDNQKTLGLGYKQTMCTDRSVSIIEHHGNLAYASFIAAHELGHSLGAKHDGYPATVKYGEISETCSADGGYIMNPKASRKPEENLYYWEFSKCSLLYFDFYINHLNANNTNCLSVTGNHETAGNFSYVYSPDEQCEHAHGLGSFMRRDVSGTSGNKICQSLPCSDPSAPSKVIPTLSLVGTRCRQEYVCHLGSCVPEENYTNYAAMSSDNTATSDDCLFGDQPGIVFGTTKSCKDLISEPEHANYCYSYSRHCCETCRKYERQFSVDVKDCQYGDRKDSCTENDCDGNQCCESCAVLDGTLVACEELSPLIDGEIQYSTTTQQHGTVATFTCNTGYQINGTSSSVCLENGTWNVPNPTCFKGCLNPSGSAYLDITPKQKLFAIGATIELKCISGFVLKGDATLQCLEDSSWSNDLPHCDIDFTSSSEVHVKEDVLVGTNVHRLQAGNVEAVYTLIYTSYPAITSHEEISSYPKINVTGSGRVIIGEGGLDYETVSEVVLVVEAASIPKPTLRARQRLTIHIEDVNEFSPHFPKDQYCCSVTPPKDQQISIGVVTKVTAKDDDIYNTNITYSLRSSTEIGEFFRIDSSNGKISFTNSSAYRDKSGETYKMAVLATDSGQPRLTGSCEVVIKIGHICSESSPIVPKPFTYLLMMLILFCSYMINVQIH